MRKAGVVTTASNRKLFVQLADFNILKIIMSLVLHGFWVCIVCFLRRIKDLVFFLLKYWLFETLVENKKIIEREIWNINDIIVSNGFAKNAVLNKISETN